MELNETYCKIHVGENLIYFELKME